MITIKQQSTVEFSAIEVKDAIVIAPLMTAMYFAKENINRRKSANRCREDSDVTYCTEGIEFNFTEKEIELMFDKLAELGFCTFSGKTTLPEFVDDDSQVEDEPPI